MNFFKKNDLFYFLKNFQIFKKILEFLQKQGKKVCKPTAVQSTNLYGSLSFGAFDAG